MDPDEDLISFGSSGQPSRRPGRRSGRRPSGPVRWANWLLLGVAVLVSVGVLVARSGRPPGPAPRPDVTVTSLGHRLLGVTARWKLFGRGPGGVAAVQPATGLVTWTRVPSLDSTGPVSFLIDPHQVIIRPLDYVPGYLVPDGKPPRGLPSLLRQGGPALPGPRAGQVWVVTTSVGRASLTLTSLTGARLASVPLPAGGPLPLSATSDGSGGILLTGPSGTFDATTGGLRRLSLEPLAVGPGRWLAVTCPGHRQHCHTVLIDRTTGAQRALPGPALPHTALTPWPPGLIAPDGAAAAVLELSRASQLSLHLLDLRSGADRVLSVPVSQDVDNETVAWSPDSRWLFVVTDTGAVRVVSASTGQVGSLGVQLPFISQVAVRDAPG
jgi:hypothetical protein